ncbi:MAG: ATP-binding protein, partial [Candidatus Thermoplasmatota archaeon]|nr:ATP-binding protein [Candidatus Thermoplasmatota archaeon]
NLVSNALKFAADDRTPRVEISATERDGAVTFHVQDNGIGIDPRDLERIFAIFNRGDHDESIGGQGVGLAICKRIIERHGGEIWVESEPGAGSTFHFTLPVAGGSEQGDPVPGATRAHPGGS